MELGAEEGHEEVSEDRSEHIRRGAVGDMGSNRVRLKIVGASMTTTQLLETESKS